MSEREKLNVKWAAGVVAVLVVIGILSFVPVKQLPAPLAQQSARLSLVAAPTVALTGAPSVGSWPNSNSRLDYVNDLDDNVFNNAGYTSNAANAHVIPSLRVSASVADPAALAQQILSSYLRANPGTPVGSYLSGGDCLEAGADRDYPPTAIVCGDLRAALGETPPANALFPYTGSNTYGGQRYTVNIALPEVRSAFANLLAAEINRRGLPFVYLDNIMHPSTGGLNGTSITFDHIIELLSSVRSQISSHGTKIVINIALSPADLLDIPAYTPHIAALQNAVDGLSFEAPLHPYYKDKSGSIANEISVIRQWLSAGKLILFVNGYNPGEINELKFEAAYSLMIRRPGDPIFTARVYFRPPSDFEWIDWSGRLGAAVGDYQFVTTSPVLMKRVFQNGTLTLNPVNRTASVQWGTPEQIAAGNTPNPNPNPNPNPQTPQTPTTPPANDTTAPNVTVTAPSAGSTIGGTVDFTAEASDNVAVTRVNFYVDGRSAGSDTTAPYVLASRLNTKVLTKGLHTFTAKAYDARGNVGTSPAVSVTVDNTITNNNLPGAVVAPAQTKAEVLRRVSVIINQLIAYLADAKRTGARVDFNRVDFLIRTIVNLLNQLRVYRGA